MILAFLGMLVLVIVDQASKIWIRDNISGDMVIVLLPNFFEIMFVENPGVSFSFLSNLPALIRLPLLLGVSTLAVIGMTSYLILQWKLMDKYLRMALIWIIPGALGNLIDRGYYGAVTDFMHFRWYDFSFFVNNLADCFISIGVVFFILSTFLEDDKSKSVSA